VIVKNKVAWLIVAMCLLFAGCGYEKAEKRGLEIFPEVKKFNQLFEKTTQEIDYHGGYPGRLSWISRGRVYDRYLVSMEFCIKTHRFNDPEKVSEAKYRIAQFEDDGGLSSRGLGELSQKQWDQVAEIDDIFRMLNHVPVK
jgi:hypothetical protein